MTELEELLTHYRAFEGNRLNMVIDSNVQTAGPDGSSRSISSASDRALLLHLRSLSGLIITDAATAATEHYKPSKFAPIEIWSKTANFRGLEAATANDQKHAVDLVQSSELTSAVQNATKKTRKLLFETGKTVSALLGALGLIDQLCLTVSGASTPEHAQELASTFVAELNLNDFQITNSTQIDGSSFLIMQR